MATDILKQNDIFKLLFVKLVCLNSKICSLFVLKTISPKHIPMLILNSIIRFLLLLNSIYFSSMAFCTYISQISPEKLRLALHQSDVSYIRTNMYNIVMSMYEFVTNGSVYKKIVNWDKISAKNHLPCGLIKRLRLWKHYNQTFTPMEEFSAQPKWLVWLMCVQKAELEKEIEFRGF